MFISETWNYRGLSLSALHPPPPIIYYFYKRVNRVFKLEKIKIQYLTGVLHMVHPNCWVLLWGLGPTLRMIKNSPLPGLSSVYKCYFLLGLVGTSIWERLWFKCSASAILAICLSIYKYLLAPRDKTMYAYMPSTVRICKQNNFTLLRQPWN